MPPSMTIEMETDCREWLGLAMTKAVSRTDRTIDVVMSTTDRDRQGDIVEASGLDFTRFEQNPVVLWAHNLSGTPIGRVLSVKALKNRVEAKVQFADTPQAKEVFGLYAEGFLKAWSIGFIPKRWERIESDESTPGGFHVLEAEVYELSACPVPVNASALSKAMEAASDEGVRSAMRKAWDDWTKARGDGQGQGGPRQGDGGASKCVCPECGHEVEHERGAPCSEKACPECGTAMTGKSEGGKALYRLRPDLAWKTEDGKSIRGSAFSKSIAESVTAGKVVTRFEKAESPADAGTEIEYTPVREQDGEIVEAKVTAVIVKAVTVEDAPETEAPVATTTPPDSRRAEAAEAEPIPDATPEQALHLAEADLEVARLRFAELDAQIQTINGEE